MPCRMWNKNGIIRFWSVVTESGSGKIGRYFPASRCFSGWLEICRYGKSGLFDGDYPTAIPSDTRKDRFRQKLSQRKMMTGEAKFRQNLL